MPQAVQVADRFHLVRNLGQALERLLIREHRVLTRVAQAIWRSSASGATASEPGETTTGAAPAATPGRTALSAPALTRVERERAAVDARRRARYDQAMMLAAEGHLLREVARRASVSREMVRSYLRADTYRPCAPRRHLCATDRYAAYLRQRWEEGEHNSAALLQELQEQGTPAPPRRCANVVLIRAPLAHGPTPPRTASTGRRGGERVTNSTSFFHAPDALDPAAPYRRP